MIEGRVVRLAMPRWSATNEPVQNIFINLNQAVSVSSKMLILRTYLAMKRKTQMEILVVVIAQRGYWYDEGMQMLPLCR